MATAVLVSGTGSWSNRDAHITTWQGLMVNTTGDVGSVQGSYGGLTLLSVYVTGTMTSDVNLQFQESITSTGVYTVGQTVCGTALTFDSTTAGGLATGTVYMVRPGGKYYRPKISAGASTTEDLDVVFVQAKS